MQENIFGLPSSDTLLNVRTKQHTPILWGHSRNVSTITSLASPPLVWRYSCSQYLCNWQCMQACEKREFPSTVLPSRSKNIIVKNLFWREVNKQEPIQYRFLWSKQMVNEERNEVPRKRATYDFSYMSPKSWLASSMPLSTLIFRFNFTTYSSIHFSYQITRKVWVNNPPLRSNVDASSYSNVI